MSAYTHDNDPDSIWMPAGRTVGPNVDLTRTSCSIEHIRVIAGILHMSADNPDKVLAAVIPALAEIGREE